MSKPNVLVLGGVGFIGRNFVKYLLDQNLVAKLRVADKVLPSTAFMSEEHTKAFADPRLEYVQAPLTNTNGIAKAFAPIDGGKFTFVFNLAAETKYGQTDEVYAEKVFDLVVKCATEAAKQGVERFVEVSTAQVYDADKKASKEDAKLNPWTGLAKYKLKGEEALKQISGLNYVVLRPAIVYGPGDTTGIAPRIICGAVYKHLDEKMKFLWDADLRLNTVSVRDVCKALWHVTAPSIKTGSVYNLCDKNDTTQEKISKHLEAIYGIKTGFYGSMMSKIAGVAAKTLTEDVNDKHLKPWSDLCKKHSITNTPLTPYLDPELLFNNPLSIDGTGIEATGFKYDDPTMSEKDVREEIDYFGKQKLFPPV